RGASATLAPRGLRRLRRRRGRLDQAHRGGGRRLVGEAERGRELAPEHLRHEEHDVDAGVREGARHRGAQARAVVALDQQARDVPALRQPGLGGRGRRPLAAHGVELDGRALRSLRQAIAHDQAQVRARLGERLEGARERARVVVHVRAPEGDTLDGHRHETSFTSGWCAPLLAHLRRSLEGGGGACPPSATRTAIDLMTRELRMASLDPTNLALPVSTTLTCRDVKQGIVEATPTRIHFRQDLNADGALTGPGEDVTYDLSEGQIRRTDGTTQPVAIVDSVPAAGLAFRYFDGSNAELVATGGLDGPHRDCVAKVRLTVIANVANPNPLITTPITSVAETEVAIRSRSLMNF